MLSTLNTHPPTHRWLRLIPTALYNRGVKYSSTYILLVKDYITFLGRRSIVVIGGVVLDGLLYPVPFAIMAAAVYAMMAGHETSVVTIIRWRTEVSVDSAFLLSLILAVAPL